MNLLSWLGGGRSPQPNALRILEFDNLQVPIYAIGDIHGNYDKFCRLEDKILLDARTRSDRVFVVVLGDFIDRGPDSKKVIDRLIAPSPAGVELVCLTGNHEATMADFFRRPSYRHLWLQYGGIDTLASYGIDAGHWARTRPSPKLISYQIDALVPTEHVPFISSRPHLIRFDNCVFVHAGIDRKVPLNRQSEQILLWSRPAPDSEEPHERARYGGAKKDVLQAKRADDVRSDLVVVHGHTPVKAVQVLPLQVNLDTGAYAGGPLSAARFIDGHVDGLFSSEG